MKKAVLGEKLGMTQIFNDKSHVIPVTVIKIGPCTVTQIKTEETDGYNAIQLGIGDVKEKKLTKPKKGHFEKFKISPKKHLREFRVDDIQNYKVGDELKADGFRCRRKS